jgi:hypothetical protein
MEWMIGEIGKAHKLAPDTLANVRGAAGTFFTTPHGNSGTFNSGSCQSRSRHPGELREGARREYEIALGFAGEGPWSA